VLNAFGKFSPDFRKIAAEFFDKQWIDAAKRHGKRGGAFCSPNSPTTHPYVFINYSGTLRDVFTLAHELGHGIHSYLMREQSYLSFGTPLTVAETASVFAEMLLFDDMRESTEPQHFLPLLVEKIDQIIATVFRQISMHRFEQDFHAARRSKGELAPEAINAMWTKRQRELYGKSVEITEGYGYWWSYIPHFLHTPFYVYAYAFGELMTLALYQRYRSEGKPFVNKYRTLLKSGCSKTPAELLKPLGVDLTSKQFWIGGLKIIDQLVSEAEELSLVNYKFTE
jgi:oligoendopeptidase F